MSEGSERYVGVVRDAKVTPLRRDQNPHYSSSPRLQQDMRNDIMMTSLDNQVYIIIIRYVGAGKIGLYKIIGTSSTKRFYNTMFATLSLSLSLTT